MMLSKKAVYWNLSLAILVVVGIFYTSPYLLNEVLFQGVLLNWPYVFIVIITIAMIIPLFNRAMNEERRAVLAVILIVILAIGSMVGVKTFSDYITYNSVAEFSKRDSLVVSEPDSIRYTARKTAFKDIEASVTAAVEEVKLDYTSPLITDKGFAYVSAITPDGFLPTWNSDNPGFSFYDDRNGVETKIKRINQKQTFGLGEMILDNFWRAVYLTDWWATYEKPHFLQLDPENPDNITTVVSKIKYKWLRIPYWAGVVLIHADGTTEDFTVDEAKNDSRLKGKWIAPMSLMRDYVEHQNYAVGYWSSFFRVPGKLEIDDVEGKHKFPFLTRGHDGIDYLVVATKAEGSGGGLFRMYYSTADSFELTVLEFTKEKTVYGPNSSYKRLPNIPGYTWFRQEGETKTGNMIGAEPVYIVRPEDPNNLYWKYTITTRDHTGTAGAAVVKASNLDIHKGFSDRTDFELWLRSDKDLNAKIVKQLENTTGKKAPDNLSIAEQICWHLNQIEVLTEQIPK